MDLNNRKQKDHPSFAGVVPIYVNLKISIFYNKNKY